MNNNQETIIIGNEFDREIRVKLARTLRSMGATPRGTATWDVAGSQELESAEFIIQNSIITLEAETYIGLSVSGPPGLVQEIAARMAATAEHSQE